MGSPTAGGTSSPCLWLRSRCQLTDRPLQVPCHSQSITRGRAENLPSFSPSSQQRAGPLTAPSSKEIPTQLGHPGQLQGGDEESDHLGTARCRLGPSSDTREPCGLAQWAAGNELRTSQHEIPCWEDPSRSVLGPHPPLPHPPEGSLPTPFF